MKLSTFVAIAAVIGGSFLISNPAEAGYNCRPSFGFGGNDCSGTINGQRFNSTTRTNVFGGYETEGTIGGQRFNQTCSKRVFCGYDCY